MSDDARKDVLDFRKARAIAAIEGIGRGRIPDGILADQSVFWGPIMGDTNREGHLARIALVAAVFPDGLAMVADKVTAEDNRVAVQAHATGVLFDGGRYEQTYHFLVEFDAENKVARQWEYADTLKASQVLLPAMKAWAAQTNSPLASTLGRKDAPGG